MTKQEAMVSISQTIIKAIHGDEYTPSVDDICYATAKAGRLLEPTPDEMVSAIIELVRRYHG